MEVKLEAIEIFFFLTEDSQKLYVRLYGRVHRWHRKSKIAYPEINGDLTSCFKELQQHDLLLTGAFHVEIFAIFIFLILFLFRLRKSAGRR